MKMMQTMIHVMKQMMIRVVKHNDACGINTCHDTCDDTHDDRHQRNLTLSTDLSIS